MPSYGAWPRQVVALVLLRCYRQDAYDGIYFTAPTGCDSLMVILLRSYGFGAAIYIEKPALLRRRTRSAAQSIQQSCMSLSPISGIQNLRCADIYAATLLIIMGAAGLIRHLAHCRFPLRSKTFRVSPLMRFWSRTRHCFSVSRGQLVSVQRAQTCPAFRGRNRAAFMATI